MKNIIAICLLVWSQVNFAQVLTQTECGILTIDMTGYPVTTDGYLFFLEIQDCPSYCHPNFCNVSPELGVIEDDYEEDYFWHYLEYQGNDGNWYRAFQDPVITSEFTSEIPLYYWQYGWTLRVSTSVLSPIDMFVVRESNPCFKVGVACVEELVNSNSVLSGDPIPAFDMNAQYCPEDEIIIDGTATAGEEDYVVTICQRPFGVTEGDCIRWAGSGWQNDQQIGLVNLDDIWNHPWWNKYTYEVMLATRNVCSAWTAESQYFNIGFPADIIVDEHEDCDGKTTLSFPILDCYDSFAFEYYGTGVAFNEVVTADEHIIEISATEAINTYTAEVHLETNGKNQNYEVSGSISWTPALPWDTPDEIEMICNDFPYCVQLGNTECLTALDVVFVSDGLNVQISGTLLCVEMTSDEFQHGVIQVRGIGKSGPGPVRTWQIYRHSDCYEFGGPKTFDRAGDLRNTKNKEQAIWPNPFDDHLQIKVTEECTKVSIYNSAGQLMNYDTENEQSINTVNWTSGIYFVQFLNDKDEIIRTEKLLKI